MSNENKKTPAEGTGVSGMLATASLAVAESDVKLFLKSILSTGLHAVVTKQGNSMRHEWGQTPDELVSSPAPRPTAGSAPPVSARPHARRRTALGRRRCGLILTSVPTMPSLTIQTRSSSGWTSRTSWLVLVCLCHG